MYYTKAWPIVLTKATGEIKPYFLKQQCHFSYLVCQYKSAKKKKSLLIDNCWYLGHRSACGSRKQTITFKKLPHCWIGTLCCIFWGSLKHIYNLSRVSMGRSSWRKALHLVGQWFFLLTRPLILSAWPSQSGWHISAQIVLWSCQLLVFYFLYHFSWKLQYIWKYVGTLLEKMVLYM